jgi:DHA1 family tetracycline resistance protein-like MFS transporter
MSSAAKKMQRSIIFFTVFLYLVGFGVIIPILPILSRDFGATATQTGALLAIYSVMQFLFSTFWGKLSDRYGRRPILLFCLLGEASSFIIFAYSRSIEGLFLARMLAGFFSASISTASAYIADVTTKSERSKGMSLIGVAFGLGFIIGPSIGGGLTIWGNSIRAEAGFATSFTFYFVALLFFVNFLFSFFFLKESLQDKKDATHRSKRFLEIAHYLKIKTVGPLMIILFLTSFAMSGMEASLILFMNERFQWGLGQVSLGFALLGVVTVITQGFLLRVLLPKFGENKVLCIGILLLGIGISGIAFAQTSVGILLTLAILSLGNGLTNPSALGSISLLTNADEQGAAMGVTQSLGSLGRATGPVFGGLLYQYVSMISPFLGAGLLIFIGLGIALFVYRSLPKDSKSPIV